MHELILWAGFLGGWLLVLGPVYQAVLELDEEDDEISRLRGRVAAARLPPPVSRWWWLLPPVYWLRRQQRRQQLHERVTAALTDDDFETLSRYVNKARGWMYVGIGGFLIASKETWELVEGNHWHTWIFWVLVPLGLGVSIGHTVARTHHDETIRAERRAASEPAV